MRLSSVGSWGKSCVGALLALLAVALAAPGRSEAGCSHYVTVQGAPIPGLIGLEILGVDGFAPSALGADAPAAPPQRPAPCSGVLCSGSPATPVIPAPSPTSRAELWGVLTALIPVARDETAHELPRDGRLRPVTGGSGVFHPPRASRLSALA
jgi:hypothetical protein